MIELMLFVTGYFEKSLKTQMRNDQGCVAVLYLMISHHFQETLKKTF